MIMWCLLWRGFGTARKRGFIRIGAGGYGHPYCGSRNLSPARCSVGPWHRPPARSRSWITPECVWNPTARGFAFRCCIWALTAGNRKPLIRWQPFWKGRGWSMTMGAAIMRFICPIPGGALRNAEKRSGFPKRKENQVRGIKTTGGEFLRLAYTGF